MNPGQWDSMDCAYVIFQALEVSSKMNSSKACLMAGCWDDKDKDKSTVPVSPLV